MVNSRLPQVALVALSVLIGCGLPAEGQSSTAAPRDPFPALYQEVLNRAFPTGVGVFEGREKVYSVTLRYFPVRGRESQINIVKRFDGTFSVVQYTVPDQYPPIFKQVAGLIEHDTAPDVDALAAQVHVRRDTFTDLPPEVSRLLNGLPSVSLNLNLNTNVILDADRYECWFDSSSNRVHFELTGFYLDPRKDYPLIGWMYSVRKAVESLPHPKAQAGASR